MKLLMLALVAPLWAQQPPATTVQVAASRVYKNVWELAVWSGPAGAKVSRGAITGAAMSVGLPGALYEAEASAQLMRLVRDSAAARWGAGTDIGATNCVALAGWIQSRIGGTHPVAKGFVLAGGAGCAGWSAFAKRKNADAATVQMQAQEASKHLFPDGGITLDAQGAWSGRIVLARAPKKVDHVKFTLEAK